MPWLSRISLANRRLVALITLLIVVLGVYAAPSLKQQLFPDLSFPAVTVVTAYQGAAPEIVEEQVTKPIEDTVKNLDRLQSTTSSSRQGSSTITLQFDYGVSISDSANRVQQAISKITSSLPSSVEPQVLTGSTSDQPTMTLAATSGTDQRTLAARLNDQVVPTLKAIDGVNEVTVSGVRDQVISITPDAAALKKAGLTTQSINSALSAIGGGTSAAGSLDSGGKALSIAVGGQVTSLRQIQDLWLSASVPASGTGSTGGSGPAAGRTGGAGKGLPGATGSASTIGSAGTAGQGAAAAGQGPVQLKDVAAVGLTDAETTSLTRTGGRPSLGISITMNHNGSSASISKTVRKKLASLDSSLGAGAKLTIVSDNGPSVSSSINGLLEEGALGLLMAVLVIVVFLRSGRSTLVTAVSIPLSLLIALIALWWRGDSLNIFTLGGLTMAVGRVVDDSIVVLENIKRHLGYGEERTQAILTAVREVAAAVTSSTLTTVAVFLPIALVGGFIGELFGPFSIAVAAAMLASLIVSLTVVPTLAYWFLKPPKTTAGITPEAYRAEVEAAERGGLLQRGYLPVITWSVGHRKSVLALAVGLLVVTFGLAGGLKTSFLGDTGQDSLTITQTLPAGDSLATTDAAARRVEQVIAAQAGVKSYQVVIGSQQGLFGSGSGAGSASYTVDLSSGARASAVQSSLRAKLAGLSGAGTMRVGADSGPGGSNDIEVTVKAGDDQALKTATQQVQQALSGISKVTDVHSDLSDSAPQISIHAKEPDAARYGLTDSSIADAVRQAVQGTIIAQVTLDGTKRDVIVRTSASAPQSIGQVKALTISTSSGDVRLDHVATVSQDDGPVQRSRVDGTRASTVYASPVGDNTGAASNTVSSKLGGLKLPAGASYEMGGITANQSDAFSGLGLAMLAAVALVFLVMVAVFRSIRQTLILLVSIPFAFTGAIGLLRVTGTPLGVAALVGILMLIGIVVTNAIVLMDLINQYRAQGMPVSEAVVEGGLRRLRPILMTALATMLALTPMALGVTGAGGFISKPLAVVVIGGLLSSTLLTLVLIPVLYTMAENRRERRALPRQEKREQALSAR